MFAHRGTADLQQGLPTAPKTAFPPSAKKRDFSRSKRSFQTLLESKMRPTQPTPARHASVAVLVAHNKIKVESASDAEFFVRGSMGKITSLGRIH